MKAITIIVKEIMIRMIPNYIASLSASIHSSNNTWYIGSRATRHIPRNGRWFNSFQQNEEDEFMYLGEIHGVGTIGIFIPHGAVKYIPNVLYVPSLTKILIYVTQVNDVSYTFFLFHINVY
jgi:hypothetical protein